MVPGNETARNIVEEHARQGQQMSLAPTYPSLMFTSVLAKQPPKSRIKTRTQVWPVRLFYFA